MTGKSVLAAALMMTGAALGAPAPTFVPVTDATLENPARPTG